MSWRILSIIAAGVVGLALAIGAGWMWYSGYQSRALAAYAEAIARAQDAQAPQASAAARMAAVRGLEGVLAEYSSSPAAGQAAYHLGNLRYAAREYPAARGAFQIALAKGATPTLQILSRTGIAYTWEAEGEFQKAVAAYQSALGGLGPEGFFYEELMVDLARAQELSGQIDAAIATYRRLLKDLPRARRADVVRARLAGLAPAAR